MLTKLKNTYLASRKSEDTYFNIFFARPLATPIVLLAVHFGLSPNQLTLLGLASMGFAAMVWSSPALGLVVHSEFSQLLVGLLFLEIAYLFDCADGQVARITRRSSPLGASLDFLMDELKAFMMFVSLSLYWWATSESIIPLFWCAGGLLCLASAISMTSFVRSEAMQASGLVEQSTHGDSAKTRGNRSLWRYVLLPARLITQYPQSLPIFILFQRVDLFVMLYASLHAIYAAGRLGQLYLRLFKKA